MNRENFLKKWALQIKFDPTLKDFPESLYNSFLVIKKNNQEVLTLKINQGLTLVSIDEYFGIKIDLDINDFEEGEYDWQIKIIMNDNVILEDSGIINAIGKPTKTKVARPWDLLNPNTEYVDGKISDERMSICNSCEMFTKGLCRNCGCFMPIKTKMAHASCPLGKWSEYNG